MERKDARYFLRRAYHEAANSPDLSTQNGAVLVIPSGEYIIGFGHNGPPIGVKVTEERLTQRPLKYEVINHAEDAAIFDAVRQGNGKYVSRAVLYCPWNACSKCACAIIASGIRKVVAHKDACDKTYDIPGDGGGKWIAAVKLGLQLLREARVELEYVEGPIGDTPELRFNGTLWTP